VTSPSSGVGEPLRRRLDFAVGFLRDRGYVVEVGYCMDGSTHISAPVEQRAAELMRMLLDPGIRVVLPPWGGETAIDLLPHLDFDAIAAAEPTWFVGYSDLSTLLTPVTLMSGWATLHGTGLMETPYAVPAPLLSWLDIATAAPGSTIRQSTANVHRIDSGDDWTADPTVTSRHWNGSGGWRRLDAGGGNVDVSGRLIGGCLETIAHFAGTRYGQTGSLRDDRSPTLIVYVEAAEENAFSICRYLHGMRLAGFFDGASAVLVGRTSAPDSPTLSQDEAVLDALDALNIPIIADVECGHVPPQLPIVNGALGRVVFNADEQFLEQSLV
jgi:muramoyltetrapeptide carboxypeptidase